MNTFSGLLDILFPRRCVFCTHILKSGEESVCHSCAGSLPYVSGSAVHRSGDYFEDCVTPLRYEGLVRKSLHRFKFKGASEYADCYGAILASCIREQLEGAPGVKSVTGMGLMIGIEPERAASDIVAGCIEKGVLVLTAKTKVRLLPALNIPMDQLARGIRVLKEELAK